MTAEEQKLHGLMGLCVRARQAVFGEDGCLKSIRSGGCGVLLLDGRASQATRDKYRGACRNAGVPMAELPEGMLGRATGKPGVAMAVNRGGLCDQIIRLLPQDREDQQDIANNVGGANAEWQRI